VDDLQWADDDSLRLLRYVVRSVSTSPIALKGAADLPVTGLSWTDGTS
jgi:predicted ATPase